MEDNRNEWQFVQLRAAQLFEEGETGQALWVLRMLQQEQARRFENNRGPEKMNKAKTISTLLR